MASALTEDLSRKSMWSIYRVRFVAAYFFNRVVSTDVDYTNRDQNPGQSAAKNCSKVEEEKKNTRISFNAICDRYQTINAI